MAESGQVDARPSREERIRQALADHEGALLAYARRLLGDGERARDVVQDAFLRLCRTDFSTGNGNGGVDDVRRWLFTVTRNRALDHLRRSRHVEATVDLTVMNGKAGNTPEPIAVVGEREAAQAAVDALDALPAKEREVIHLKFREGLSYRQIADVTGLSLSYVGVLIHTGMKRLRGRLAPVLGVEAAGSGDLR